MADQTLEFGDIGRREEQQKFNIRLRNVIKNLANAVWHPGDKRTILKFLDALQWTNATDESVLPFYSRRAPYANRQNKIECLFAAICYVVQKWWEYQQETTPSDVIENSIIALEAVVKNGLDQYKTIGNLTMGYILTKKE